MTTSHTLALAVCVLIASCSGNANEQGQGAHRVVAILDVAEAGAEHPLTAALHHHPGVAAVFEHDAAIGAAAACAAAQRAGIEIVSGFDSGAAARQIVADGRRAAACASVDAPAAAIDIALLACSGISVPKELGLGVTWFTAANVAAGGTHEVAPGDLALNAQRRQHAATLTTTPAIDVVFRIGLVDDGHAAPGGKALRDELVAAAKRYPQLELLVDAAPASGAQRETTARGFIAKNVNALLVVTDAHGQLAKVCAEAAALNIKVVVLGEPLQGDGCLCRVAMDPAALGRAAAAALRQVLPRGGDVVELRWHADPDGTAVHDAFVRSLGPKR